MNRQQRIAIAVLVVAAGLFTGSAVHGRTNQNSDALRHPGGFIAWFGTKPPDADVSADCLKGGTITVDKTCTLRVPRSTVDQRAVRLRADQPATVEAPVQGRPAKADAKPGDTLTVTVDGAATDIVITCDGTCTLTLVRGD
jgi:hypothetical protein